MHRCFQQAKIHFRSLARNLGWLVLLATIAACGAEAKSETTPTTFETDVQPAETINPPLSPVSQTVDSAIEVTQSAADHCIDCHRDKQQLIDTAAPEESQEAESSGEG